MPNTSDYHPAKLLPTYETQPEAARMREVYVEDDGEDSNRYYDFNYQAYDAQSAAGQPLQWHGIELTPMLVGTTLCGVFALWVIWAALR
ncbi:uncharacterized protein EKO05_0007279 [Ascochyta rabiei]|uniref:Uncharacterized protein n=1 Tax=Didymella rabiei TaxID=5454 RepID=A0A163BVD4_DIDRA|nr:uncharacterized protein EKO05_0007279 [Ascochyta rabiei]KZM22026.1 hypothetical protein ST47_g6828 [Ascochyta rabiei]UPX16898.1 hypothetical protein EKO05_0007279 [Ascochyta rabiei]